MFVPEILVTFFEIYRHQTPNTMLEFSLKNGALFKNIFSNFVNQVTDCVLKFDEMGMISQSMDSSHVSMVSLMFVASEMFDDYKCTAPTSISLSISSMLRVMKLADKNSTVKLSQKDPSDSRLTIGIVSKDKKTNLLFDLNLMDIDTEELDIPDDIVGWKLNVNYSDLSTVIKNMGDFGDVMSICFGSTTNNELLYQVDGSTGTATGTIQINSSEWTDTSTVPAEAVTLKLSVSYIKNYLASRDISDTVEILMGPEIPFCMSYRIADQSHVAFYIAPKMDEDGE